MGAVYRRWGVARHEWAGCATGGRGQPGGRAGPPGGVAVPSALVEGVLVLNSARTAWCRLRGLVVGAGRGLQQALGAVAAATRAQRAVGCARGRGHGRRGGR